MTENRPVTVVISATKALEKWLGREIPRMPSADGKRVGTQPLVTDSHTVSWQCHVVENRPGSGLYTVIAVEAHSRYAILIPFDRRPTLKEFWIELERAWGEQLVHLMCKGGLIEEAQVKEVFHQFLHGSLEAHWYRNTDLSVNGHVADAEQWVKQSCEHYGVDRLDKEQAFDLGLHINEMFKRAKNAHGVQETFYPITRFLADGLYRFARGLAKPGLSGAREGDYPNPYACEVVDASEGAGDRRAADSDAPSQMQDSDALCKEELDFLARMLAQYGNRESIAGISELDGFLTAIVSGPEALVPSRWFPSLWGGAGLEPEWESGGDMQRFLALLFRHMNHIADTLMERPRDFHAIFLPEEVMERGRFLVEDWCAGYTRAIAVSAAAWQQLPQAERDDLGIITAFSKPEHVQEFQHHDREFQRRLAGSVEDAARTLHAYWLARRSTEPARPQQQAPRPAAAAPKVGRNEPCPCGSGKKYKKCCLH